MTQEPPMWRIVRIRPPTADHPLVWAVTVIANQRLARQHIVRVHINRYPADSETGYHDRAIGAIERAIRSCNKWQFSPLEYEDCWV